MQCSPAVFEEAVSVGWQLVGGAAVDPEGEQDPAILLTEPWVGGHSERQQHSAGGQCTLDQVYAILIPYKYCNRYYDGVDCKFSTAVTFKQLVNSV